MTPSEGYIHYSRGVALTRLVLVACFVMLLTLFTPWRIAMLGVLEFGLYLALFAATEIAARNPDHTKAFRRLCWQSDLLMFLLIGNACWIAVLIRLHNGPTVQIQSALLAICVLLFVALRVHITRIS